MTLLLDIELLVDSFLLLFFKGRPTVLLLLVSHHLIGDPLHVIGAFSLADLRMFSWSLGFNSLTICLNVALLLHLSSQGFMNALNVQTDVFYQVREVNDYSFKYVSSLSLSSPPKIPLCVN